MSVLVTLRCNKHAVTHPDTQQHARLSPYGIRRPAVAVSVISSDCSDCALVLALHAGAMIATTPLSKVAQSVTAIARRKRGTTALLTLQGNNIAQPCEHIRYSNAQGRWPCKQIRKTTQSLKSIAPLFGMPLSCAALRSSAPLQRGRLHRRR
ncbi:hypothetical protein [Xanthomonas hortorum]|uniref:hypothetical protein n=1 Tax=Xanthomonas hortorum TaxID=56454 RepID=UPI00145994FF|nr:hypothetical protein [Xanthomonas hortorum]MCM5526241.1 hypothetical protein [Xanthomonas hortorum pv. pelargonii]MCM5536692.1 hypothetical protein [Xanthomonas hortorum pv. pelargonii]MCM5540947.1 hypothetical protein [Xanthomonas hortorum pv. pelargonii]MCM5546349.1 hypothetical protein [Xanthomonas hortorum pv. pelargonii]MCM5562419.1 hypothetical protein [Xanthomonas hortorum pv. pelargonii]